eukprot:283835_1
MDDSLLVAPEGNLQVDGEGIEVALEVLLQLRKRAEVVIVGPDQGVLVQTARLQGIVDVEELPEDKVRHDGVALFDQVLGVIGIEPLFKLRELGIKAAAVGE